MGLKVDIAIGILFFNHLNTTTLIYIYIYFTLEAHDLCAPLYMYMMYSHEYINITMRDRFCMHVGVCVCVFSSFIQTVPPDHLEASTVRKHC